MKSNPIIRMLLIAILVLTGCASSSEQGDPVVAAEIDRDVDNALAQLYETHPEARDLAAQAKGILVFPHVYKAGFIAGAQYGKGALLIGGRTAGYYNIISASYGLQAGAQAFNYTLFFMNETALDKLDSSAGFEVGVGPSVVIVDAGMAKSLTTMTLQEDVYAFIYGQQGLMAGLGLQGSKITRITP